MRRRPERAARARVRRAPAQGRGARVLRDAAREPERDAEEFGGATEEEFHQPPVPLQAAVGDAITLTGTNLGVRLRVTVLGVEDPGRGRRDGTRRVAVRLALANDGIAVFESHADRRRAAWRAIARCPSPTASAPAARTASTRPLRLDVGNRARGCLVFDVPAGVRASDLLLALEQVPAEAGGRWRLG